MRVADGRPIIGTSDDITPMVRWLLCVAALVILIVAVGGITRLTESGLSITQWKPITGALPPLTEAQWQAEFAGYKQIPQYLEVNGPAGMTLAQYKFIYFWEWVHRLLARLIGLAFALPLAWFWLKRTIPLGYKPRLLALLALGGLQGAVGWWMVSSGLSPEALDRVSHFRLAAHLITALVTLGGLIWTALDLAQLRLGQPPARVTRFGGIVLSMLAFQLFMGAMVAGLRAGYVAGSGWFNAEAWPLMQGSLFPDGVEWGLGPLHVLFSDPYMTHFIHRWWAWAVVAVLVVLARHMRALRARGTSVAIHCAFGIQILLGIFTVWSGVTLWIAVAHQLCAALLVAVTVWGVHILGRRDMVGLGV
ncbi:COX15/CtaA family protein [Novosphingobium mathurense]|uniref:Heme A synthase n=1 Tax=Novosphingobium mathurense TaxID=428990 RepID=A0A1U6HAY3_9SPHN|nr:COX15/CtaA family protein [Novosphingobium mathurense]SLJ92941.1 cytochrome c oxidase assembly protein subunit 15 [Novosphingobium mathurense]